MADDPLAALGITVRRLQDAIKAQTADIGQLQARVNISPTATDEVQARWWLDLSMPTAPPARLAQDLGGRGPGHRIRRILRAVTDRLLARASRGGVGVVRALGELADLGTAVTLARGRDTMARPIPAGRGEAAQDVAGVMQAGDSRLPIDAVAQQYRMGEGPGVTLLALLLV